MIALISVGSIKMHMTSLDIQQNLLNIATHKNHFFRAQESSGINRKIEGLFAILIMPMSFEEVVYLVLQTQKL